MVDFVAHYQQTTKCNGKQGCFKSGTKWNYSNTNYFILGLMVEKYYQMNFVTAINRYILESFQQKGIAAYFNLESPKDSQPDGLHAYYELTEFSKPPYFPLGKDVF